MIKDIIIHIEGALVTTTPDHPQALVPLPKTPARATALPSIVRRGGPAAVFATGEFLYAAAPGMVSNWSRY